MFVKMSHPAKSDCVSVRLRPSEEVDRFLQLSVVLVLAGQVIAGCLVLARVANVRCLSTSKQTKTVKLVSIYLSHGRHTRLVCISSNTRHQFNIHTLLFICSFTHSLVFKQTYCSNCSKRSGGQARYCLEICWLGIGLLGSGGGSMRDI